MAFSAHTDSKGIIDLVNFLAPKHVMMVHGEKPKMAILGKRIQDDLGIPCYYPANNETLSIPTRQYVRVDASSSFINSTLSPNFSFKYTSSESSEDKTLPILKICDNRISEGLLIMERNKKGRVVHQDEWSHENTET